MIPLQIAVATNSFRQPLRQSIVTAAQAGAGGVLFDARNELIIDSYGETGRRQLLHELDERGLKVAALSFPLRRQLHDPEQLERRIDALRGVLHFASQIKCRVVTVNSMFAPADPASREADRIREVLAPLVQYGYHIGVTLLLTPVGEPAANLVAMLSTIQNGPVGVDFDPAGCVRSNRKPLEELRAYATWVGQCQVHDAVRGQDGDGREAPVGRGEVDWPPLLAMLHEIGFRGWMMVRRNDGTDPIGDCTRAIEFVRRVALGG
jgi:sugar phosphate isomerase/epimerase